MAATVKERTRLEVLELAVEVAGRRDAVSVGHTEDVIALARRMLNFVEEPEVVGPECNFPVARPNGT